MMAKNPKINKNNTLRETFETLKFKESTDELLRELDEEGGIKK